MGPTKAHTKTVKQQVYISQHVRIRFRTARQSGNYLKKKQAAAAEALYICKIEGLTSGDRTQCVRVAQGEMQPGVRAWFER